MATCRTTFGVNPEFLRQARGDPDSEAARVIRGVLGEVELLHFANVLPDHFDESAYAKYGFAYTQRTAGYVKQKRRRYGHNRPMLASGRMYRELLGQKPTLTSKLASRTISVTAKSPRSRRMNLWSGKRRGPNFEKELNARRYAEENAARILVQRLIEERMPAALERGAARMQSKVFTA